MAKAGHRPFPPCPRSPRAGSVRHVAVVAKVTAERTAEGAAISVGAVSAAVAIGVATGDTAHGGAAAVRINSMAGTAPPHPRRLFLTPRHLPPKTLIYPLPPSAQSLRHPQRNGRRLMSPMCPLPSRHTRRLPNHRSLSRIINPPQAISTSTIRPGTKTRASNTNTLKRLPTNSHPLPSSRHMQLLMRSLLFPPKPRHGRYLALRRRHLPRRAHTTQHTLADTSSRNKGNQGSKGSSTGLSSRTVLMARGQASNAGQRRPQTHSVLLQDWLAELKVPSGCWAILNHPQAAKQAAQRATSPQRTTRQRLHGRPNRIFSRIECDIER